MCLRLCDVSARYVAGQANNIKIISTYSKIKGVFYMHIKNIFSVIKIWKGLL